MSTGIYDYLLAGILVCLSVLILRAKDLLVGIILFIAFGMFVALAWVQLKAPDIALVEVVIGSALTGALFLGGLAQIESNEHIPVHREKSVHGIYYVVFGILLVTFAGWLYSALAQIIPQTYGLKNHVMDVLKQSGVGNPVTAVVLNIRGYDTLLEVGVLLISVIAIFALNSLEPIRNTLQNQNVSRVLKIFIDVLSPLMIVIGFYLLWIGASAPGGAFQAGAMLAGVGILLLIRGTVIPLVPDLLKTKLAYSIGFLVFAVVGFYGMLQGKNFLTMSYTEAKILIFIVEVATTLSIAATLITLFAGSSGFLTATKEQMEVKEGKS